MKKIQVSHLGEIRVKFGHELMESDFTVPHVYHEVEFVTDGKIVHRVHVGQPIFFGGPPRSLYDTVHSALSFWDDDAPELADEWMTETAVPYGEMEIIHTVFPGKTSVHKVDVTRYYGEPVWSSVDRALRSTRIPAHRGWLNSHRITTSGDACLWVVTGGERDFTLRWSGEVQQKMKEVVGDFGRRDG